MNQRVHESRAPGRNAKSPRQSTKELYPSSADLSIVKPLKKRHRTSLACQNCRSRKIKCDTTLPICGTCQIRGRQTTCSYETLADRDKRRETERYVQLLEAELSQYKSSTGIEDSPRRQGSFLSKEASTAASSTPEFPISQSPQSGQNGTDSSGDPHVFVSQKKDASRASIEQEVSGCSTRSFMAEVQQAPMLSSFAVFDEVPHEPGAKAGFFTREINEQLAKFPSLSESYGARVALLTPSWLQHLEDVYFSYIHHFFPFLEPENWHGKNVSHILKSGATNADEDLSSFAASALCMVDMVYALGALWSTRLDPQQSLAVSERFFLAAKKLVTLEDLETPSLQLAQNLMLITQYCVSRTHRQRGFLHASLTYLSLGIRVCRSLKFSSLRPTCNTSPEEYVAINLWRGCLYFDIVFASACGEPTMVHSREYTALEDAYLAVDEDPNPRSRTTEVTYYEHIIRLTILIHRFCVELYDNASNVQASLQASFFNANFILMQRNENSLSMWRVSLPKKFKLYQYDDNGRACLLDEQRLSLHVRYHYAQILLYRPALSCLSKLQSNNSAQTTAGDREIMNSFAQECLAQFARKGLQAAIHTVDLLLTCQGSGTGLVAPVRNFTPMCFYLYNAMLVMIAAKCCANDTLDAEDLDTNWRKSYNIMRFYQRTARTYELPFKFFEVINERLFQHPQSAHALRDESSSHLLLASESWNMFDWYPDNDIYNSNELPQHTEDQTIQSVDTISSQWLGSFLSL